MKEETLKCQLKTLREKRIKDKEKYNNLKSDIIRRRREILREIDELKDKVKDIMYVGDIKQVFAKINFI